LSTRPAEVVPVEERLHRRTRPRGSRRPIRAPSIVARVARPRPEPCDHRGARAHERGDHRWVALAPDRSKRMSSAQAARRALGR